MTEWSPAFEQAVLKLRSDLEVAIEDTLADNPELSEDEIWHDLAISVALDLDPDVRQEFFRREGVYVS